MTDDVFDVNGKIAVVTGATGVLCSEMCRGLAKSGATVVAIARNEAKIESLVQELREGGYPVMGLSADVLVKSEIESATSKIIDAYGRIDILIINSNTPCT